MPYYRDREAWRKARDHQVAELIAQGHTHAEIGKRLGITGPAVTHWIRQSPALRQLRRRDTARRREQLAAMRHQLSAISDELRSVQQEARRAIRELDEELQAIELDVQLGLR